MREDSELVMASLRMTRNGLVGFLDGPGFARTEAARTRLARYNAEIARRIPPGDAGAYLRKVREQYDN